MHTKMWALALHLGKDGSVVARGEAHSLNDATPQDMARLLQLAESRAMRQPGALAVGVPDRRRFQLVVEEERPDFEGTLIDVTLRGDGSPDHHSLVRQVVIRAGVRRMKDLALHVADHSVYDTPRPVRPTASTSGGPEATAA